VARVKRSSTVGRTRPFVDGIMKKPLKVRRGDARGVVSFHSLVEEKGQGIGQGRVVRDRRALMHFFEYLLASIRKNG